METRDPPATSLLTQVPAFEALGPRELARVASVCVPSFLAVLERAGVVSQGRGRVTVHDPDALKRYVF